MSQYFSSLIKQSLSRSTEATLSMAGITHAGLREHLSSIMNSECGTPGSFLAPPMFEQTFGWTPSNKTMLQLVKEGLLSKKLVDSLDQKEIEVIENTDEKKVENEYRFPSNQSPYKHQLASWRSLLEKKNSIVVTSGTGSGKTECFMIPVLEDLYQCLESNNNQPLEGVHALFLYPLNALINSQQERLDAWTQNFGDKIRYCLYNGNTPEKARRYATAQNVRPNEVLTRESLREHPAPILVTNGTMLEYMMVRQVDAPIIEKSRKNKTLRWIVLDEAHTYIGSQAAELAMQLRRVLNAFDVKPEDIRFVATSATIAGEDTADQLKKFLSDLSGVPTQQIDVIGGERAIPDLPASQDKAVPLVELENMTAVDTNLPDVIPERYQMLTHSPEARILRHTLTTSETPLKADDLASLLTSQLGRTVSQDEVLRWVDVCTATKQDEGKEPFLRVRGHIFQRTTQGIWACINPSCNHKNNTPLVKNWPYGMVYANQRSRCECGSIVLELAFCNECNEPHLLASEKNGRLIQWQAAEEDEFSLTEQDESLDVTADGDSNLQNQDSTPFVLSARAHNATSYPPVSIESKTGKTLNPSDAVIELSISDRACCANPSCEWEGRNGRSPFRRAFLGSPFYVANAVPTVLEYCPDYEDRDKNKKVSTLNLPGRGRRLITFTDSRQGTARMSMRMQQEAERNQLRGLVLVELAKAQSTAIPEWKEKESELRASNVPENLITQVVESIKANAGSNISALKKVSWGEVVNELSQKDAIKYFILKQNQLQQPRIFSPDVGAYALSEMLLYREFMRRPKRQNSLETLGIVAVGYQKLEEAAQRLPDYWEAKGLSKKDWRDFLKVCLDFYVRENTFVELSDTWRYWIGNRFFPKTLLSPTSKEQEDSRTKRWPQIRNGNYNQRLIKLLLLGSKLNPNEKSTQDLVNNWLSSAWDALTQFNRVFKSDGGRYYLAKEQLTFSLMDKAWVCSITHKLIDTTFCGFTPYLPNRLDFTAETLDSLNRFKCKEVELPEVWHFEQQHDSEQERINEIRAMVSKDPTITNLRSENLWTDISDRTVEGGFYYRTAEHSAQQSADRLKQYENSFKAGEINVLNCSTTMEMGVDIDKISAVVMNNVPPHPANYLQRAGRAGRSEEARAIAYTLCKNNPHDQQVFSNPLWPFETLIQAPTVALNSARLVQRHANAMLLSHFLCNDIGVTEKDKHVLTTGWFYERNDDESLCDRFIRKLETQLFVLDEELEQIVKGTALNEQKASRLRKNAVKAIKKQQEIWHKTFDYLQNQAAPKGSPYESRLKIEKGRHLGEYLLRDLAARTFLPGYGFPTDVVNFDNFTIEDFINDKNNKENEREDSISRYKNLPSRNLAIAIREYAPGAEIAIDGKIYKSAGVSLHWHNLYAQVNEAQKFDIAWRCNSCGELGYEEGAADTNDLYCTNNNCLAKIKDSNIKKVLVPAGFITDAYQPTTNDVSFQKYIPVQQPWVIVKGAEPIALPNPSLGFMRAGADGVIFNYSDGEYGTGYALCTHCGRSHSMNDEGEFPKELSPNRPHKPPRPGKEDRSKKGEKTETNPCSGQGSLQQSITLGAQSRTDVFELVLKNPSTNEYLIDDGQEGNNRGIAITLAVALRFALASKLGVSASEIGFSTRPAKIDGSSVLVIQLYDELSGGAGFSSSSTEHIESLLVDMYGRLQCSHCQTSCSECLLDSSTRHFYERLNNRAALEWLGSDFKQRVQLDETAPLVKEGHKPSYQPMSIEALIRKGINQGAKRLVLRVTGNSEDWDLSAKQFKKAIHTYRLNDDVQVDLLLSEQIASEAIQEDLLEFQLIGVNLRRLSEQVDDSIAAQLVFTDRTQTIASNSPLATIPGVNWHQIKNLNLQENLVVSTYAYPEIQLVSLDTSPWKASAEDNNFTKVLEVSDNLNGGLKQFGERFWSYIGDELTGFNELINDKSIAITSISYSDRYLQSPAYILMLASLLRPLSAKCQAESIQAEIRTLFKRKEQTGNRLFHDWSEQEDFENFSKAWLKQQAAINFEMKIFHSNRDIPHHRKLNIEFSDGSKLLVRFDQGVGYWRVIGDTKFDFTDEINWVLSDTADKIARLKVINSEDWPTNFSLFLNQNSATEKK